MRSRTQPQPSAACDAATDPRKTDTRRRRFLLALGAGGASATAAAVTAAPAVLALPDESAPAAAKPSGYRETAHVRDYYRTARI